MSRSLRDETQGTQGTESFGLSMEKSMETTLVEVVLDDYEKAKKDRDTQSFGINAKGETLDFKKWFKDIERLYTGERESKVVPWKFCSNRSLRIGTAILEMLHSRLFSGVWNENLTRWRPGEVKDTPKVERISKFMDWWVRVWSPMREFFESWTKITAGYGDSLTEISWEVEEFETSETEEIPITDEAGSQLTNPDGTPSIQQQPKMMRIEKSKARIIPKDAVYFMKGARDVQKDPVVIEEEFLYKDLEEMELQGKAVNVTNELSKFIVVSVPEGNDPVQKERLTQVKRRNVPIRTIRWYGHYDLEGTGLIQSVRVLIDPEHRIFLGGIAMKNLTKSGRRPLEYTKYGSYLHKIDELFGEGVLDQVKELSDEVDAIFNQMTDANTLSVLRPGFFDPSGDVDAKAIKIAPNIMHPVTDPSHNVYFPEFQINTDRLINAIRMVLEFIERLTAASSYVMGRESDIVGGSGTATRTQAIIQSAEIRFARPVERLKDGAARILTRLLDVIQLNIPPGMETRVLGEDMKPIFQAGEISDMGISGQFDAYLLGDASMGSKETERQIATTMYSLLIQNPLVATDPYKLYKITADILKSAGKDPEEYLGPEPKIDDIDNPEDENTLMVQGEFDRVRANLAENHLLHIQTHMQLMESPSLQLISQTAPNLVNQIVQYNQYHIQEHQQMLQTIISMVQSVGKGGGTNGIASGQTGQGSEQAGTNGSKKTQSELSMANGSGPLGQALNTQASGVVQPPS